MDINTFEVGAYFYPLTTYCPDRSFRAWNVGDALNMAGYLEPPNEFDLVRNARPLFEGHEQPVQYCLDGDPVLTEWDDSESGALVRQCILAKRYGLSYFMFDAYDGMKNGQPYRELYRPAEKLRTIAHTVGLTGLKYAKMQALESPRVVMPIPVNGATKGFGNSFAEPDRGYDLTAETARFIVDCTADDWFLNDRPNPHYLRINGKPYLSLLMPNFRGEIGRPEFEKMDELVSTIRDHSMIKYGLNPYLVGVMRQQSDCEVWGNLNVDAVTQYCDLPEHGPESTPIQQYSELIEHRRQDWPALSEATLKYGAPFIPSPAVGWDASPRGEQGHNFDEVAGVHPYSPIVVGNTPELFGQSLRDAIKFTIANVPKSERKVTIFAWNEIGENSALLHRLRSDGTIDRSRLQTVSRIILEAALQY